MSIDKNTYDKIMKNHPVLYIRLPDGDGYTNEYAPFIIYKIDHTDEDLVFAPYFANHTGEIHLVEFDKTEPNRATPSIEFYQGKILVAYLTTVLQAPEIDTDQAQDVALDWDEYLSKPGKKRKWNQFFKAEASLLRGTV